MHTELYSPEANAVLYDKLRDMALPHVERSDGQLKILTPDTDKHPSQALGVYRTEGKLGPPDFIEFVGQKAMPNFVEESYALVDGTQGGPPVRQEAQSLLRANQSIVIATDHDDVTSPAYPLAGFTNSLRKANMSLPQTDRLPFKAGIIVSKMLSVLGYEVYGQTIPCMQVLEAMCDRVYLSYPRSKTFLESGLAEALPPNHIPEHNDRLKGDIKQWMALGAVVLGESLLASTHGREEDGNVHTLRRVTYGSAEMVTRDNIHLLPVIVGLTEADRYMQRFGPFQQLASWEDVHPLHERMATARTERNRANGSNVLCVYQTAEQAEAERRLQER